MQTAPSSPSHVPMYNSLLHDQMNFVQQMENFLRYLFSLLQKRYIIVPIYRELLERHFAPGTDLLTIQQSANIWLMRMDFVFEFPRPTMPNVVFMGGFQCQPAQALPTELEEFIQGSVEHGVSIMSLGAVVSALPTAITEAIATAFAEIPQKVLWRYQGEQPSTLENITLILEWFPQNDLLGHPTTCVFVSHGGTNGIYSMKLFTMESPSQLCHSSLTCLTMFCDCRFEVRLECFKSQCSPRKSSSKPSKMSKLSELNCDRPCLLSIAPLFGLSTLLDTKEQLTFTQRGIICLGTLTTT